jgi:hypothetical protein
MGMKNLGIPKSSHLDKKYSISLGGSILCKEINMKFKFFIILGLMVLLYSALYAETQPVLISIPYSDDVDYEIYQKVSVLHITEKHIIAEIPQSKLAEIKNYTIIDHHPWTKKYFLITSLKREAISIKSYWGELLFQENNLALIKTDQIPMDELVNNDYSFVELKRKFLKAPEIKICPEYASQTKRGVIDDLITLVEPDSVESYMQALQDFQTRYAYADTRDAVAQWIADKFTSFGINEVIQDSFYYDGIWHKNVVATLPGSVSPDEYIFIGGHHDSIVHFGQNPDPMVFAPGADDNASGAAGVLEMARVIMEMGYQPDVTIVFCTFGAEEIGLVGSYFLSTEAAQAGLNLRAMINADMIANNTKSPGEWLVDVYRYTGAEHLYELALQLIPQYTTLTFGYSGLNSNGSDSYYFWVNGYDPVYFFENEFSPYYHSNQDIVANCDVNYCSEVIRLELATLISLASMPPAVANYQIWDVGNGSELFLQWDSCPAPNLDHYRIDVGTASGVYDSTFITLDTTYTLTDLTEGQVYYVGVSAVNTEGTQSFIVEKSLAPESMPRTPENFTVTPEWFAIEISWFENPAIDLDGYELYRSEIESGPYEPITGSLICDTLYVDSDVISGQYYYYFVTALDEDGNCSLPSDTLKSRAVTLDQGILLVDDTKNGSGSFMNPTDAECDLYYDELLDGYNFTQFDTYQEGQVTLAQIGAYSTIFWYIDDCSGTSLGGQSIPDLKRYLDFGGQLLLSGFRLTDIFSDEVSYPRYFSEGSFCYDYLKLSEAYMDNYARFYYADPTYAGFEAMYVDTTKTLAAADYHLIRVESVTPNDEGFSVYNYESLYDDTSPFGSMNGMPISSAYFGDDYKTFVIPVPLYYIQLDHAKSFIDNLFQNYFDEVVGIDEPEVIPNKIITLYQNYPNPFSESTTISFNVHHRDTENAEIKIYNLKGQLVKELEFSPPAGGSDLGFGEAIWDGKDNSGKSVANGIYFYKLSTEKHQAVKKMIVIR